MTDGPSEPSLAHPHRSRASSATAVAAAAFVAGCVYWLGSIEVNAGEELILGGTAVAFAVQLIAGVVAISSANQSRRHEGLAGGLSFVFTAAGALFGLIGLAGVAVTLLLLVRGFEYSW